jgi:hypothetical protein
VRGSGQAKFVLDLGLNVANGQGGHGLAPY